MRNRFAAFPVSDRDEALLSAPLNADGLPDYRSLLADLSARPFPFGWTPRHVVLRDDDHAPAWVDWFTRLQLRLFEKEMDLATKRLRLSIRRSADRSTLGIWFELSTIGHPGFGRYGIRIRKLGEHCFACRE